MKPESDKLSVLLRDTVLLLCRNGFNYKLNIKVQGLIGITLDDQEIFLVHFNELVGKAPPICNDVEKDETEDVVVEKVTYQSRPAGDSNPHQQQSHFYYNNSSSRRRHSGRSRRQTKLTYPVDQKPNETENANEFIKNNNLNANLADFESKRNNYCFADSIDNNITCNVQPNEQFLDRQSLGTTAANEALLTTSSSSTGVIMTKPENINDAFSDQSTRQMNSIENSCLVENSDFNIDNYNNPDSKINMTLGNNDILDDNNNDDDDNENNNVDNSQFDTSQLPIKEESDVIDFNFATLTETDCIENIANVSMYGTNAGITNSNDNNNTNNNDLMSLSYSSFSESSRGRRARRSGQKLYTCEHPNCGLSFYRSYTLYRHQRLKHGQRLVPPVTQQSRDVEFRCGIDNCGQTFFRVSMLEKHEREFHGIDSLQPLMADNNLFSKQYHNPQNSENNENLLFEGVDYALLNRQNMT